MAYSTLLTTNNAFAVTPSDTVKISAVGFRVGGSGGDVAVMPFAQEAATSPTPVIFTGMAVGEQVSLNISRFMATDTTADDIVAFGPK